MSPRKRFLRGLGAQLKVVADAHKEKRITLWFQDEARIGQKGRVTHRWYWKGKRASGLADNRFTYAYLFAAVRVGSDDAHAWVLPHANKMTMQHFLDRFATEREADEHAVMVLDQAGWHDARALAVPENVTLIALPPYSPELNPIERVILHLKQRYLSHRLLDDYDAIAEATAQAWRSLVADRGRLASITAFPWIMECVNS